MFQDKTIVCKECKQSFVFEAGEQEVFAERGYQDPLRCKPCIAASKEARGEKKQQREMFDAICSECGNDCKVPFQPNGEKPVYCSDCFKK